MKKPFLLVLGLFLIAIISTYFIVPQFIVAKSETNVDATDSNVLKFLMYKKAWPKWWPGQHNPHDPELFAFNGMSYTIKKETNSYIEVENNTGKIKLNGKISYMALDDGSTTVQWTAQQQSSLNPLDRVLEFIRVKKEAREMDSILASFKKFMLRDSNVYGMNIKLTKIKDGTMLATNIITPTPPNINVIYQLIASLRKQAGAQGATVTNQPMLTISRPEGEGYHTMVALPINKEVKPGTNMIISKMVVGGNILEAEITGGRSVIDNAIAELKNYQKDHWLISPAMPFEQMITDRSLEKDTSKWVTKVYWPIF